MLNNLNVLSNNYTLNSMVKSDPEIISALYIKFKNSSSIIFFINTICPFIYKLIIFYYKYSWFCFSTSNLNHPVFNCPKFNQIPVMFTKDEVSYIGDNEMPISNVMQSNQKSSSTSKVKRNLHEVYDVGDTLGFLQLSVELVMKKMKCKILNLPNFSFEKWRSSLCP
ncbi:hypothetical protein HanHA300_Chr09g0332931 [Helianthus annuus]|nr:hypothetical protein HanHA300_Chr09g0332931 [Helianthus annuus]KAJ0543739.1 hypothetical protein HanHA89_Chr09g0353901 [Helianthus annuus]KAJ0708794.1 hypothetical protein HanLR1_Chr09g0333221 [Helianthus annuus]